MRDQFHKIDMRTAAGVRGRGESEEVVEGGGSDGR